MYDACQGSLLNEQAALSTCQNAYYDCQADFNECRNTALENAGDDEDDGGANQPAFDGCWVDSYGRGVG